MEPQRIKRDAAKEKLLQHWLTTLTPQKLLDLTEPAWDRLRNYEYECKLKQWFSGEWMIDEYCPFNDKYCKYGDYVKNKQKLGIPT